MKKYFALSAILAASLFASVALAQDTSTTTLSTAPTKSSTTSKKSKSGGAAANKADSELASLTKDLTLTDDQQAKIKPILLDEHSKISAARKGSSNSADDQKAKTKAIRDSANQQIRALLTPDQQKLFDASAKSHASKKAVPAAAATSGE